MKNTQKIKEKKRKIKKKVIDKSKKQQVLVVAQEIRLARLLSGNEKKTRDKVLKTLKKWLVSCFDKKYDFKEDDFTRVWKGLFYAVWMSDKPLVQEDLCESIAGLLDQFPPEQVKHAILMTKAGFKLLATEWYGIDHHRMDKFLMLVRRYLRGSLRVLARCEWSEDSCRQYTKMLSNKDGILAANTPHYARNATSMIVHYVECFLEELAKVSNGTLPEDSLVELLNPFCRYMCEGTAPVVTVATRRLLTELIRQSDKGLEYQEAKRAWEKMGCPEGGPEALELIQDDDNEDEMEDGGHESDEENPNKPLDPRAGRVDVLLPTLPVPASKMAALLKQLLVNASSKAHKRVKICLQRFEKLAQNEYPLPIEAPSVEDEPIAIDRVKSAQELSALEKKLVLSSDELALRGLRRKHRKRLLAKSRAGLSIVDDVEKINKSTSKVSTIGEWEVESTEPSPKKPKLNDTSNKENNKIKKPEQKPKNKAPVNASPEENKKHNVIKENGLQRQAKAKIKDVKKVNLNKDKTKMKVNNSKVNTEIKKDVITETNKKNQKGINKLIDEKIKQQKNIKTNINDTNKKVKMNGVNKNPVLTVNKVKNFQKSTGNDKKTESKAFDSPKHVKFVLKNNSMQGPVDYYKSVRQSPKIPFDGTKKPTKTNLKVSTPSPINPFFKKKMR